MELGLKFLFDFFIDALIQSSIYGAIALGLSLAIVYFLWKEKYLYREDYLKQGLTYMNVTTWVLVSVFVGFLFGAVRTMENKTEFGYKEFIAPQIKNSLPMLKTFLDKGLSKFSDKPLSIEDASRKVYLEIRVFLKDYEFSEDDQIYSDLLEFPGSDIVGQWFIKGILKGLVIYAMNESDSQLLDDSLIFSYSIIQNLDLKNINDGLDKAFLLVFMHHLKGLFWGFYLQLFLVYLLISALFSLELWISRPSPISSKSF